MSKKTIPPVPQRTITICDSCGDEINDGAEFIITAAGRDFQGNVVGGDEYHFCRKPSCSRMLERALGAARGEKPTFPSLDNGTRLSALLHHLKQVQAELQKLYPPAYHDPYVILDTHDGRFPEPLWHLHDIESVSVAELLDDEDLEGYNPHLRIRARA